MKRFALGLFGLALVVAPLQAQTPPPAPAVPVAPAPGVVVVDPSCAPDCGPSCAKHGHHHVQCVPEHYVRQVPRLNYCSGSEPLCLCFYHGLFRGHGCGCDNGHCEHGITRRYLVKKVSFCEQDAVKCVPACAGCPDGRCGVPFGHAQAPAPAVTITPVALPTGMITVSPAAAK